MVHHSQQSLDYSDVLLLDTGSECSVVPNKQMVDKIRPSSSTLHMATNAGHKVIKQEATLPGFGSIWYDKTAIANILGFPQMVKIFRVTFDSAFDCACWQQHSSCMYLLWHH